ncbi:hypothetical protein [Candidatus Absconditicoccus praedator]|uniref:hypothetical protein n=1 Tax=Candidatus Absconditicoccus praedator TaxID=2735562 RepID=UPI001E52E2D4|nr:hypothetical protein [Candidatus Absconditicoccus praedator]UFX83052.1 hypothetical protein HLG78_02860 [Candidatus Absconditicoccus praedator]
MFKKPNEEENNQNNDQFDFSNIDPDQENSSEPDNSSKEKKQLEDNGAYNLQDKKDDSLDSNGFNIGDIDQIEEIEDKDFSSESDESQLDESDESQLDEFDEDQLDESDESQLDEFDEDYSASKKGKLTEIKDNLLNKEYFKEKFQNFRENKLNKEAILGLFSYLKSDLRPMFYAIAFFLLMSIFTTLYYGYSAYSNYQMLNERTDTLNYLDDYHGILIQDLDSLDSRYFPDDVSSYEDFEKIGQIVDVFYELDQDRERIEDYMDELQAPYHHFLNDFYLPSLNIWQEPFSEEIDKELFGQRFLDDNPYLDTNLIDEWSNFFRYLGDQFDENEVLSISIGEIEETEDGDYFSIQLDVEFETPERRNFLMLVDRMSVTSNKRNISLINDFTYNLWEVIKSSNPDSLKELDSEKEINNKLGKLFYNWIENNEQPDFISEEIIQQAINESIGCDSGDDCFYEFRQTFRNLPYLAYTVGDPNLDQVDELRNFYKQLPPLIGLEGFSFRDLSDGAVQADEIGYIGEIRMRVYGENISSSEVNNIQEELGKNCFGEGSASDMNYANASSVVEDRIDAAADGSIDLDSQTINDYHDLIEILDDISERYSDLINYDQARHTFEMYRMLNEADLCE